MAKNVHWDRKGRCQSTQLLASSDGVVPQPFCWSAEAQCLCVDCTSKFKDILSGCCSLRDITQSQIQTYIWYPALMTVAAEWERFLSAASCLCGTRLANLAVDTHKTIAAQHCTVTTLVASLACTTPAEDEALSSPLVAY